MSDYGTTHNQGVGSVHMGDNVTTTNRTEIRHEKHFDHRTTIGVQQNIYQSDPNVVTYDEAKEACQKHGSRIRAASSTYSQNEILRKIVSGSERNFGNGVLSVLWPWKSDREWPTGSAFVRVAMESKIFSGYYPVLIRGKISDVLAQVRHGWLQRLGDFEEYRFFLSGEFAKSNKFVLISNDESPKTLIELYKAIEGKKEARDVKILSVFQMSSWVRVPWARRDFDLEPGTVKEVDEILAYVKEHSFRTEPGEYSLAALRVFYEEKKKRLTECLGRESKKTGDDPHKKLLAELNAKHGEVFGIEKSDDSSRRTSEKSPETGLPPILVLTENPRYFERNLYEVVRFVFSGMSRGRKLLVLSMVVLVPYLVYLFLSLFVLLELFLNLSSTIGAYTLLRYLWVNYIPKE